MKTAPLLAVGLAAMLGFTACGSDAKKAAPTTTTVGETADSELVVDSATLPGVSVPDDITLPDVSVPDVSFPDSIPGVSGDCIEYVQAIAGAFTGVDEQAFSGLGDAFAKLKSAVPDDLKDDVETLSVDFGKLGDLYAKYDYDYVKVASDPEFNQLTSDEGFTQASDNVSDWIDGECQGAG